jgi:tetratricopeptide (TPR) repeat protein
MRHLPADKYNIAWFKLAECVSRGEKERALGVYRLLSHSLEDEAFVYQLEGDILLAFGDSLGAIQRYKHTLQVYKRDERFVEAAAIAEHIFQITEEKLTYAHQLVVLYSQLCMHAKAWEYRMYVVRFYGTAGNFDAAIAMLDTLAHDDVYEQYYTRKELFFSMIVYNKVPRDVLITQGNKVIDLMCMLDDHHESQQFFIALEAADVDLYHILMQEKKQ